jgi:hypothetical protein
MAFLWVACGGGQEGPEEPDGEQVATSPPNTVGTWGGVQPTSYPTAASTPYVPPPVTAPPPPNEQECRARAARPVAYDVNGVTDVKVQLGKFFDAHHETFRCCFDALEAPTRPLVNAKVSLIVRIEADGKFTSAEFAQGSDPLSPATSRCIMDVAATLSYPAPIGGKPVGYNRIFDFKAHR